MFDTIDHTELLVDSILEAGAKKLYNKYLVAKLPEHIKQQQIDVITQVTNANNITVEADKAILRDWEAKRIVKDNYTNNDIKIKKVSLGTNYFNKKSVSPKVLQPKHKLKAKFNRQNPEIAAEIKINTFNSLTVIPLENKAFSTREMAQIEIEHQLRTKKNQSKMAQMKNMEIAREKEAQKKIKRQLLQKQFQEICDNKMLFTYHHDGTLLTTTTKNIHAKTIDPDIRVNINNDNKKYDTIESKSRKISKKSSIHLIDEKIEKKCSIEIKLKANPNLLKMGKNRINFYTLGSDPSKNQMFNNNHNRQMSNIKHISLAEGAKLTESNNQISSVRRLTLNRNEYCEKIADSKFKSHFILENLKVQKVDRQVEIRQEDFQIRKQSYYGGSTYLPTSSDKKEPFRSLEEYNTIQSNLFNSKERKPATAEVKTRYKSATMRPKTTTHGKQKVIANRLLIEALLEEQ